MPYHYGSSSSDIEYRLTDEEGEGEGEEAEQKTQDPELQRQSRSASWLNEWDHFDSNVISTKRALDAALTLLRDISDTSTREWHEAIGDERPLSQSVSQQEVERILHRGKFIDEIRRQVINALCERDVAIQKTNSLEFELFRLRQDMCRAGENLYAASNGTDDPLIMRDIRRVASGLIEGGKYGSRVREHKERQQRRLQPYPQCRLYTGKTVRS
ncbi:MAG: hypothetical protein NXY57DRAFT_962108 [Lentinula lateritia]|nr:MAG: hypothetical protein NXY57DRAFT_962108 [Lentinula lateritia]